jgi:hypothetical protein
VLQDTSNEELHITLWWVQADVRMSRRTNAFKGLGMKRRT